MSAPPILPGPAAPAAPAWLDALARELSPESRLRRGVPLAPLTTLRVGGPADVLVEPAGEADLARVVRVCRAAGVALLVLGCGSNLLVRDGGFRGVVVRLGRRAFGEVNAHDDRLHCGAAATLRDVAAAALNRGLGGLEFLAGIPGSVGGALRMNAGAMGRAMVDVTERVRFMEADGEVLEQPYPALGASYRSCPGLEGRIVLGAVLRGEVAERPRIRQRIRELNRRRWQSQPSAPSAGCVFKNPPALPAGRLIEELGLKGTRIGGARVSEQHANFIVTENGASAGDVLNLIELIRKRAREVRGIELETEVQVVGE